MSQSLASASGASRSFHHGALAARRRFAAIVRALLSLRRDQTQPQQPSTPAAPPQEPGQQAVQRPPRLPTIVRSRPRRFSHAVSYALAAVLVLPALPAAAASFGLTEQDRPFASGGVSIEESQSLRAQRDGYHLWLVTAAERSGAYLSDTRATITDSAGQPVLETVLAGPYLMLNLEPGRYEIALEYNGQVERRTVTIDDRTRRDLVVYFDSTAERSPDLPPLVAR